jgi:hypothetical protein
MVPAGSEFVRMANGVGATLIRIERTFWTDCPVASSNLNSVNLVPVTVGVPEMFPVDGANTSPVGNAGDPEAKLHV